MLVAEDGAWFAYPWFEKKEAPDYASHVDIHNKPGYDPVELHFDFATKSIPLNATFVKGSHGAPANSDAQRGIILSSQRGMFVERPMADTDVCELVLRQFGI